MKKFEQLSYSEQRKIAALFANWLGCYINEIVEGVLVRFDEIYNNETAMKLIEKLYDKDQINENLFNENVFNRITWRNRPQDNYRLCSENASSYREVLYDMYIKDIRKTK